jgi:B12 binding domain
LLAHCAFRLQFDSTVAGWHHTATATASLEPGDAVSAPSTSFGSGSVPRAGTEGTLATVAQEHFASSVVRGRLLGLGRGWGAGVGPLALLACLPGELHDLGLIAFGLSLHQRGWRIAFLGADTPLETLDDAVTRLRPRVVVVSASEPVRLEAVADELSALAIRVPISVGGKAAAALPIEGATVLEGIGSSEAFDRFRSP